tara:strand:- start:438 stop:668 length:231 start_codon:yes stop_codon:yes gene_type:complete
MIIMGPNFTKFAGARAAIMLEALTKGKNKVKLILNWRYQGPRLPFFFVKNKSCLAEAKSHSVAFLPPPHNSIYKVL